MQDAVAIIMHIKAKRILAAVHGAVGQRGALPELQSKHLIKNMEKAA